MCVWSEVVQVLTAYESTGPEQLTIQPGQLIHVHKKSPSGWWEGELQVNTSSAGPEPAYYADVRLALTCVEV